MNFDFLIIFSEFLCIFDFFNFMNSISFCKQKENSVEFFKIHKKFIKFIKNQKNSSKS